MSEKSGQDIYPRGTVTNEEERAFKPLLLMQPDGTIRAWTIQVGVDSNGDERAVLVELDRSLAMSMHGEDPSGDIVGLLTDEQRLLRTRPFEPYQQIVVTDIGVAWTVVAENAVANSINRVWVEIWKYHTGTQPEGVDIRFDDGGATHEIVHNLFVTAQAPAPKFGPYHLTNGWSIDMQTNVAARCRCVATIEHYGMDAL